MNLIGILSIMAWTSAWSVLIFGSLKALKMLRVSASMELIGMNIHEQCTIVSGYDCFVI